ncbi:hypothetical protein AB1M95_00665 [Sulfitobacter sp. LCG007]
MFNAHARIMSAIGMCTGDTICVAAIFSRYRGSSGALAVAERLGRRRHGAPAEKRRCSEKGQLRRIMRELSRRIRYVDTGAIRELLRHFVDPGHRRPTPHSFFRACAAGGRTRAEAPALLRGASGPCAGGCARYMTVKEDRNGLVSVALGIAREKMNA